MKADAVVTDERHKEHVESYLLHPEQHLEPDQRRHLAPRKGLNRVLFGIAYRINRTGMKTCFRYRVEGRHWLPRKGPLLFVANHASSLDPFALGAALPWSIAEQVYWGGRRDALLRNPIRRFVNRHLGAVPIPKAAQALAVGAYILQQGRSLVWFPEGTRSRDGALHEFHQGAGMLLMHSSAAAVPMALIGTCDAFPVDSRLPRFGKSVTVRFGKPLTSADIREPSPLDARQIAKQLHDRVEELLRPG